MSAVVAAIIGLAATTGVTATVLSTTDANPDALYDCHCEIMRNGSRYHDRDNTFNCCPDEGRHNDPDFHFCTPLEEATASTFVECCPRAGPHHGGSCSQISPNSTATANVISASPNPSKTHQYSTRDVAPTLPPQGKKGCQCWGNMEGQLGCCVIAGGSLLDGYGCVINDDGNFFMYNECCNDDVTCMDIASTSTAVSNTPTTTATSTGSTTSESGGVTTISLTFGISGFETVTINPTTSAASTRYAQPPDAAEVLSCQCGAHPPEPIAGCCQEAGGSTMDDTRCVIPSDKLYVFEGFCSEPHCSPR